MESWAEFWQSWGRSGNLGVKMIRVFGVMVFGTKDIVCSVDDQDWEALYRERVVFLEKKEN